MFDCVSGVSYFLVSYNVGLQYPITCITTVSGQNNIKEVSIIEQPSCSLCMLQIFEMHQH